MFILNFMFWEYARYYGSCRELAGHKYCPAGDYNWIGKVIKTKTAIIKDQYAKCSEKSAKKHKWTLKKERLLPFWEVLEELAWTRSEWMWPSEVEWGETSMWWRPEERCGGRSVLGRRPRPPCCKMMVVVVTMVTTADHNAVARH